MSASSASTSKNAWRKRNPEKVRAQRQREYQRNKERIKARAAAYVAANREKIKDRVKWKHLRQTYGLTKDAFFAMLRGQADACAICRVTNGDWVVDHDHARGHVRGILCRQCNIGLGAFKDDPTVAVNAAKYLMVK